MKKILVVCVAVLLPCFLVRAQGADDAGTGVGLSVIPRIDLTPEFAEGNGSFTLGNSSLYSLFEGNITDNLSFSVCNHWLSASPSELYVVEGEGANIFRSDWTNWLDWAYLSYDFGNISISLGKDIMFIGGLEFDAYDFEVHPQLASSLWNNCSCYQWGGKISYMDESETTQISARISSSPYTVRPFESGILSAGLEWRGEYGPLSNVWSVLAVGDGERYHLVASLGQKYTAGDFSVELDWTNCCGTDGEIYDILCPGNTLVGKLGYTPSETTELILSCGYENNRAEPLADASFIEEYLFGGLAFHWSPIENLRLHAVASLSTFNFGMPGWEPSKNTITATLGVGALYYFNLKLK